MIQLFPIIFILELCMKAVMTLNMLVKAKPSIAYTQDYCYDHHS